MINRQELIDVIHHALEGTDRFLVEVKVSADNVIEVLIDSMDSVTIDHCIALNDAVLSHFDRDVEDYEPRRAKSSRAHSKKPPMRNSCSPLPKR